jgi:prophage regulatory protein
MTDIFNPDTAVPRPSAPPALAGTEEILALLVKISRQGVRELTFRSDFPEPLAELAEGDVWFLEDIKAWINGHGDAVADVFGQAR